MLVAMLLPISHHLTSPEPLPTPQDRPRQCRQRCHARRAPHSSNQLRKARWQNRRKPCPKSRPEIRSQSHLSSNSSFPAGGGRGECTLISFRRINYSKFHTAETWECSFATSM